MKKSKIIIKEYGKSQLDDELEELDEMLQEAEDDINRQKDYEKSRPYKDYKDNADVDDDDDDFDYDDDDDDFDYDDSDDDDDASGIRIKKNTTKKADRPKVVVASADMYISTASKVALILSILGITFLPGGTLAVLDLCSKDPYRKKWMSWLSLYISIVWLISIILVSTGHGWVK